jgi:hypothetical protein
LVVLPKLFYIFEIAQALAREPDRLEVDWDEAHRISATIYDAYMRGEFAEEEVMVRYGDPPRIGSIAEAKQDAMLRGMEWTDVYPMLWYAAVALTESATKRFVGGCGLAGASRVLLEWFPTSPGQPLSKVDPKQRRRPGPQPGNLTRYDESDRALYGEYEALMNPPDSSRPKISATAASIKLAEAGTIKGPGTAASRAKRFRDRHKADRGRGN